MTDEQQEAADSVAEAMRVFNATVRQAAAAGLVVDVDIVPMMSTRLVGQVTHQISPRVNVVGGLATASVDRQLISQ